MLALKSVVHRRSLRQVDGALRSWVWGPSWCSKLPRCTGRSVGRSVAKAAQRFPEWQSGLLPVGDGTQKAQWRRTSLGNTISVLSIRFISHIFVHSASSLPTSPQNSSFNLLTLPKWSRHTNSGGSPRRTSSSSSMSTARSSPSSPSPR